MIMVLVRMEQYMLKMRNPVMYEQMRRILVLRKMGGSGSVGSFCTQCRETLAATAMNWAILPDDLLEYNLDWCLVTS